MEFTHEDMLQLLEELQVQGDAEKLITENRYPELYQLLRTCRGGFLEELHQSQKKLDQLDYLIYQIKKKSKNGAETKSLNRDEKHDGIDNFTIKGERT